MAEFPTYEQIAKNVAEKALDEILYDGKSIRKWMKIIGEQESKTEWIPIKTRPMTEEETEHYFEYTDMRIDDTYTILDCPLPDDGQEVLVSWGGNVCIDTFFKEYDGCYFEGVDIDDVDAWQPLPKPYKAESEDKE